MDWSNIDRMDPHLLVGVINTALRNHYPSLDELCRSQHVDQAALVAKLAAAGYDYLPGPNQFR